MLRLDQKIVGGVGSEPMADKIAAAAYRIFRAPSVNFSKPQLRDTNRARRSRSLELHPGDVSGLSQNSSQI